MLMRVLQSRTMYRQTQRGVYDVRRRSRDEQGGVQPVVHSRPAYVATVRVPNWSCTYVQRPGCHHFLCRASQVARLGPGPRRRAAGRGAGSLARVRTVGGRWVQYVCAAAFCSRRAVSPVYRHRIPVGGRALAGSNGYRCLSVSFRAVQR